MVSLLLFCALFVAVAADELQVKQYAGPTECEDADKVKVGDQLGVHYVCRVVSISRVMALPCSLLPAADPLDIYVRRLARSTHPRKLARRAQNLTVPATVAKCLAQ